MRRPLDARPWAGPSGRGSVELPTLARARELGIEANEVGWFGRTTNLLAGEPKEDPVLGIALVVRALVQTRGTFDREDELGTSLVERLLSAGNRGAGRRLEPSSWQGIVAVHDRTPRACTACTYTPGKGACATCSGSGQLPVRTDSDNETQACIACSGLGLVVCSRCDGQARTQRVTVRTWQDRVAELEHVFLPRMEPALHEAVAERLLAEDELPRELRVDLDRPETQESGSYRANTRAGPPRFHGIDASVVLGEARETLARLGASSAIERAIEAHAVPVLLLSYSSAEVALVSLGDRVTAHVAPL